jgi:dephospho-CoA kinase
MKIIGIIGAKIAGKETAARYLATTYIGKHIAHSSILFEITSIMHVPATRDNVIKLAGLRKIFGESVLTNALNHKITEMNATLVIVTGVRFQNELDNIRSYADHLIVAITAPLEVRYERQAHRAARIDDKTMTFQEFAELEGRETEIGITDLIKQADVTIDNSGTLSEFHAKLDEAVKGFVS